MMTENKMQKMIEQYNNIVDRTKNIYRYNITQTIKELSRDMKNVSTHDIFYREACNWIQELQNLAGELEAARGADDIAYVASLIDRQIEKIAYLTAL